MILLLLLYIFDILLASSSKRRKKNPSLYSLLYFLFSWFLSCLCFLTIHSLTCCSLDLATIDTTFSKTVLFTLPKREREAYLIGKFGVRKWSSLPTATLLLFREGPLYQEPSFHLRLGAHPSPALWRWTNSVVKTARLVWQLGSLYSGLSQ